jgi:DNA-binding transcriptional MocR family regulator
MSKINLQSNYPVLAEQDASWQALLHEAVDRFGAESVRLGPFGGSPVNRAYAAAWLRTSVERTWICSAGHHGLITSLLAANLIGKTIVVEATTYPWFLRQATMLGARIISVPMDKDGLAPQALRDLLQRETVAAIYTMPTHHNPLGIVSPISRRNEIVAIAREHNLTIIEDAAYSFLVPDEPPRYIDLAPERSFYVASLSKRVVPGLRTAFLAAPEALGSQVELALRVLASGSTSLLVSLGCEMAHDGRLDAIIRQKRTQGAARLAKALEILKDFPTTAGPNSWHIWLLLPSNLTPEDTERLCEDNGVLITGAHWFTAPDAAVPPAVRLALGGETDWSRAAEGLEIFTRLMHNQ